jgi:hypothetical protein
LRAAGGDRPHQRLPLRRRERPPGPEGIITRGHGNKYARTVAIRHGETINAPALLAMFRQIIASNRASGGRRKPKHAPDPSHEHTLTPSPAHTVHYRLTKASTNSASPPAPRAPQP